MLSLGPERLLAVAGRWWRWCWWTGNGRGRRGLCSEAGEGRPVASVRLDASPELQPPQSAWGCTSPVAPAAGENRRGVLGRGGPGHHPALRSTQAASPLGSSHV